MAFSTTTQQKIAHSIFNQNQKAGQGETDTATSCKPCPCLQISRSGKISLVLEFLRADNYPRFKKTCQFAKGVGGAIRAAAVNKSQAPIIIAPYNFCLTSADSFSTLYNAGRLAIIFNNNPLPLRFQLRSSGDDGGKNRTREKRVLKPCHVPPNYALNANEWLASQRSDDLIKDIMMGAYFYAAYGN